MYVEGRLQTSSWQDRQSQEKKYRTEIVARDLIMLDNNGATGRDPADERATDSRPGQLSQEEEDSVQAGQITDEDIPF